jgi:hypothetical protein
MPRTRAAAVKLLTHALVRPASGVVPQAERSNRNQRSNRYNCNQRGVRQAHRQPGRALGQPSEYQEGSPPHQQPVAAAVSESLLAIRYEVHKATLASVLVKVSPGIPGKPSARG